MTEPKFLFSGKTLKLREMSKNKFPMIQCAKALSQTNGDLEKAFIWLQEHPGFYI